MYFRFPITLVILLIFISEPVLSQHRRTTDTVSTEQMKEVVAFLQDSQQIAQLTERLQMLIKAQEAVSLPDRAPRVPVELHKNIFGRVDRAQNQLLDELGHLSSSVDSLTRQYETLVASMPGENHSGRFGALTILIAGAAILSVAAGLLMRSAGRKLQRGSSAQTDSRQFHQWSAVVFRGVANLGPAMAIMVFLTVLGIALPLSSFQREWGRRVLLGFVLYAVFRAGCVAILAPGRGKDRLFSMSDRNASLIDRWLGVAAALSFGAYLLATTASLLGHEALLGLTISTYQFAVLALMALALLRHRVTLRNRLVLSLRSGESKWKSTLKTLVNSVLGQIHLIAAGLPVAAALVGLLGRQGDFRTFVFAVLRTSLTIAAALIVIVVWRRLIRRCSAAGLSLETGHPGAGQRVSQYFALGGTLGSLTIAAVAVNQVSGIWGVDAMGWFGGHAGVLSRLLHVVILLLGGVIGLEAGYFAIRKIQESMAARMSRHGDTSSVEIGKRVATLGGVLRKILLVSLTAIVGMTILDVLGFDIKPMLAGVGIVGLAVGFGAQNLVRDIISGLFVIFENRIRVGDVAIINGTGGLVEQVNLRTSVLRGQDGTVHVFPNGAINTLSNMTHDFSYYVFNVAVAYKEDTDRVSRVLQELGDEIMQEEQYRSVILSPLEVLGVDSFGDSSVVIRARIKTVPIQQWNVGREMNRRIKKRFDQLGIEIPFPHRTLYFGDAVKPVKSSIDTAQDRQELKSLIRETIREISDPENAGRT